MAEDHRGDTGHRTEYGFRWGPMDVERASFFAAEGIRWLKVRTDGGQELTIRCSAKGHRLHVYDADGEELLTR